MANITQRPWGTYQILIEEQNYKVKKIVVNPHSRLSLQSHKYRNEHWIIVEGQATITLNDKTINANIGEHIYINALDRHRISNFTDNVIVFIEIQTGTYLGEDDIVRYEDDYGRK